jgi:hypothetical protein
MSEPAAHASQRRVSEEGASQRLVRRFARIGVLAALAPIVVAAVRALVQGWIPVSENALYAIRARDVFTSDIPLVGTLAGAAGDNLSNQPGALLFDVLAVPVRLLGGGPGVIVGVSLLNGASVLGIAYLAHRRGGPLFSCAAVAVAAALCWTMGSTMLFEPWNPHSVLLPFLCFLLLAWSVACGDVVALPWLLFVGSLVFQTHLSYVLLVPALSVWALAGLVYDRQRARAARRTEAGAAHRRTRRVFIAATIVFALCWVQPLVDQFTSDGPGNLTRLARSAGGTGETTGYNLGVRLVADVISMPPWWFRPSFRRAFVLFEGWRPPSTTAAVLSLALVATALAWCAFDARRRRDRTIFAAVTTAAIALAVGLFTAVRAPLGTVAFLRISPHVLRWLWPVAAFFTLAVAVALMRRWIAEPRGAAQVAGAFTLATVAFAALNLPASTQSLGPSQANATIPAVKALDRQMGVLERDEPLLVDNLYTLGVGDAWSGPVIAELQRRGIAFVVQNRGLVRQYGRGRRYDGTNARAELLISLGDAATQPRDRARRVALHEGLTDAEQRALAEIERALASHLRADGIRFNREGRSVVADGGLPELRRAARGAVDPTALFESRELRQAYQDDLLEVSPQWRARFARYADLQTRWDRDTVALFVRPLAG